MNSRTRLIMGAAGALMVLPMGNLFVEAIGLGVIAVAALVGRNS